MIFEEASSDFSAGQVYEHISITSVTCDVTSMFHLRQRIASCSAKSRYAFNHFIIILYVDQINQMLLISYKGQFYYIHVHAVNDCFTIIVSDCKDLQLFYLELHRCNTVHHRMQHITWLSSVYIYYYSTRQGTQSTMD